MTKDSEGFKETCEKFAVFTPYENPQRPKNIAM